MNMDQPETFIITLPPLLHILFYAGGLGVLAGLLVNALHERALSISIAPILMRTVFLSVICSAAYSLIYEGFNTPRMAVEGALLLTLAASPLLHARLITRSPQTARDIFKVQSYALLRHAVYMLVLGAYFFLSIGGLYHGLKMVALTAPQDHFVIAFMLSLNAFLLLLFTLTHRRIPLNPDKDKHHFRQTLRIMLWPLMMALILFILPLVMEKYVQSEEYLRAQNPPQYLHGI